MASTASETYPLANSQPYNFLNLDLYAQDTWKLTRTLTWTFGIRDTYNLNPLYPHDAVARLAGLFDAISHDANQPLSQAIRTGQSAIFASTPVAILQPRTALAWQFAPHTVLRTGFGLFSDLLPGSVVDLVGTNPPYSKTFQGGLPAPWEEPRLRRAFRERCGRNRGGESAFHFGLRERRAFLRLAPGESSLLPSADFDDRGPRWQAPRSLFHAVELHRGTPNRQLRESASAIRGHARGQSAL